MVLPVASKKALTSSSIPLATVKINGIKLTLIHFLYSGVGVIFLFFFVQENPYIKECFLPTHSETPWTNIKLHLLIFLGCFTRRLFLSKGDGSNSTSLHTSDKGVDVISFTSSLTSFRSQFFLFALIT